MKSSGLTEDTGHHLGLMVIDYEAVVLAKKIFHIFIGTSW